jgi:hypothetical protein
MPFAAVGAIAAGVGAATQVAGALSKSGAVSGGQDTATARADQARADLQPWVGSGGLANTASADLLGLNGPEAAAAAMGQFQTSPGYGFQLSEGLRAVDAGAAAKGMLRSGATLKAEQQYGAGLADQDFTDYYNRLAGISKLGESAAAGQGAASLDAAQTATSGANQQASIYGDLAKGLGTISNQYANNSLYADRTAAQGGGTWSTSAYTPPTVYQANGFMGNYA